MAARSGMANLILLLRGMTYAGTADYSVAGVDYWTDNHLQDVLDKNRLDVFEEQLQSIGQLVAGNTTEYKDYRSNYRYFEETTGGTAVFYVSDGLGTKSGTVNWTADYNRGVVTFAADTAGLDYYVTGRSYDLNGAAADVWDMKATYYANQFDWSSDNHSVRRGEVQKHCLDMADKYRRLSNRQSAYTTTIYRSDVESAAE